MLEDVQQYISMDTCRSHNEIVAEQLAGFFLVVVGVVIAVIVYMRLHITHYQEVAEVQVSDG